MSPTDASNSPRAGATAGWTALLVFAVAVYFSGLGGQYVPTNGDELVYAHIARLTAATGHWLPLASELYNMRNTKPPLLFWQAMAVSDWGRDWQLFTLRLPSVIYTLLTTAGIAFLVRGISHSTRTGMVAACIYLAFFCTFRYGRPYLTSAPETFWLFLPLLIFLWFFGHSRGQNEEKTPKIESNRPIALVKYRFIAMYSIAFYGTVGVAFGLGAAYKSFALIAPAAAALWCAMLVASPRLSWRVAFQTSLGVLASALIGIGIFALWFVFDPDPRAVWREFVVGENAGKMVDKLGWWHEAIYGGGSSLWAMGLAYVENAGLLAFVVLGFAVAGITAWLRQRRTGQSVTVEPHTLILLVWLAVWLLVFSLPSQRSARYVIPAMPALAMLLALYWDHIARGWFLGSMGLIGIVLLVLGRVAWVAQELGIAATAQTALALTAILVTATVLLCGIAKPAWTRACTVAASLLVFASFNLVVAPLDGNSGRYDAAVQKRFNSVLLAVPSNFNAQFERFEFVLPGNQIKGFDYDLMLKGAASTQTLNELLQRHEAVVWVQVDSAQITAPCLPNCKVIATRWVVKERHRSGEITWNNLWYPHTWLFNREWLLAR